MATLHSKKELHHIFKIYNRLGFDEKTSWWLGQNSGRWWQIRPSFTDPHEGGSGVCWDTVYMILPWVDDCLKESNLAKADEYFPF